MAASATPADQTSDLMQKLSLDSRTKRDDASEATKKASSGVQNGPKVAGWQTTSSERSATPVVPGFVDPSMCYANGHATPAYYYGVNEWEEYPRYLSPGIDMSPHGIYGDMYHGYACAAYGAYPPGSGVPTIGHDGHLYELYSPQHYQYPEAYYQSNAPAYPTNVSTKPPQSGAAAISTATENPSLPVEKVKANSDTIVKVNAGSLSSKPVQKGSTPKDSQNRGSVPGVVPHNYHDQRFGYNGLYSPSPWLDASVMSENRFPTASSNIPHGRTSRNQNAQLPLFMGSHPLGAASGMGLANADYPRSYMNSQFYGQYGNALRNGQSFGSSGSNANGRNWLTMDGKYNVRGRGIGFYGYGNENVEVLNELNRGPRSGRKNGQKDMGSDAVKGQNLASVTNNEEDNGLPNGDLYNKNDFPDNYADAKFFVIKSYSEDDIHKSIKYGVWASTPNGNKKLDDAYKEAEAKSSQCPIFLFFSVNTSGQFVGVAEMIGAVDFNKTVEYWQQDKWNGCFSVKWHIVKDVPNSTLKHIILENNENKPVTNSRDTQEVKLEQGNQMLKLFKEHVSKTSVLDDFGFYETRQKIMQARRVKQQFQKQVWDGKAAPTLANISISNVAKQKLWEPAVAQEITS